MIENEIHIMKSCNHPNIVKLYEEFETKDEVYLVTDLVKVGHLLKFALIKNNLKAFTFFKIKLQPYTTKIDEHLKTTKN